MAEATEYQGPERRRHRMYVTRNREYHFRDRRCVGVRDRLSGAWLDEHAALDREWSTALWIAGTGVVTPVPQEPNPGHALFFGEELPPVITSEIEAVVRPQKDQVGYYLEP